MVVVKLAEPPLPNTCIDTYWRFYASHVIPKPIDLGVTNSAKKDLDIVLFILTLQV